MSESYRPLYMPVRAMGPAAFDELRKKVEKLHSEGFIVHGGPNVWVEYEKNDLTKGVVHVVQVMVRRELIA